MRTRRIGYLAGTLAAGGAERELVNQVKALQNTDWEPIVFSMRKGEPMEDEIRSLGVELVHVNRRGGYLARGFRLSRLACKYKVTLLHSQHFFTNAYAALVNRLTTIKTIGSIQSDVYSELVKLGRWGRPCLLWPRWLTANSDSAFKTAVRMGRPYDRTFYLQNGINLEAIRKTPRLQSMPWADSAKIVLGAGRLIKAKRFDRFLRVMAAVCDSIPNAVGIIAGEGPCYDDLLKARRQEGLTDANLRFLGQRDDLLSIMKHVRVFLLTSDHEGCPNVVQEALASGLPVVATRVGGVPDVVADRETGFIVDGSDLKGQIEAVKELLVNDSLHATMADSAKKFAGLNFSLERLARDLHEIYGHILES